MPPNGGVEGDVEGDVELHWIDPDLLEIKFDDCVCRLCLGVMQEPSSGCPEGHCFCSDCYVKELRERKQCPTCCHPVADGQKLVRIRPLEGVISQLRLRCANWAGAAGPAAAKRARMAGGPAPGNRPDAGCGWRGFVGELTGHLEGCGWVPVKCPNEGCGGLVLRKDFNEHTATLCQHREVKCCHCETAVKVRLLAAHEACCPNAWTKCPNVGCLEDAQRGWMGLHREVCGHEEVVPQPSTLDTTP
jgi:hypothetical protein